MSTERIDSPSSLFPVGGDLEPKKVEPKLSFEQMKRSLGNIILLHQKLKREHHHVMVEILDADHQASTAKHADSYRSNLTLFMTAAKVALEGCAVLSIATPQIFMNGGEVLKGLGLDLISRFDGDVNKLSDASNKLFSSLGSMTESAKQVIDNRQVADRTEIAGLEARFKSLLEQRRQYDSQTKAEEDREGQKYEELIKQEAELISRIHR